MSLHADIVGTHAIIPASVTDAEHFGQLELDLLNPRVLVFRINGIEFAVSPEALADLLSVYKQSMRHRELMELRS